MTESTAPMEVEIKQEPGESLDLESKIIQLCQENPAGITDQVLQTDFPNTDINYRLSTLNRLLSQGKLEILRQGKQLLYRLKDPEAAKKVKGADNEEKLIYQIIEEAGNKGIWIRDIRQKSNLILTQVNKILKNLESKKLIKAVKSVSAAKKKVYMLFNLEPDRSITGGAWYSEQEFEAEFIDILNQQCHRFLTQKLIVAKENSQDPVWCRNSSYASSQEVWKYINDLGISKVQLSVEDIEMILNTLIYDGKVEKSISVAKGTLGIKNQGTTNLYRVIEPIIISTGLMRMPCGVCPLPLMPSGGRRNNNNNNNRASAELLHLQSRVRPGSGPSQLSGPPSSPGPPSISACSQDCSEEKLKPVCGTDGRTYESRCEVTRAKCEGHNVDFLHNGKCSEMTRCRAQRAQAQARSKATQENTFVPECKEDGGYVQEQCHSRSGYCWCVDDSGKLVSGSMVHNKKANCGAEGSRRMNRRRTSSKGPRQLKVCSNGDRSTFNRNLIEIFSSEYDRIKPSLATGVPETIGEDPLLDTEQKRVVQWKFTQLDSDKDQSLKRMEIRDLRKMVKKIVRPRPCAKSFTKYCDLDHNKKISRSEWSACLGVDINMDDDDSDDEVSFPDGDGGAVDEGGPTLTLTSRSSNSWGKSALNERASDAGVESREEDFSDCLSARRSATEAHHAAPTGGHYIPECTPDGGYQAAQCHQHTGYCWCVHHKNGKPIRGTATHGDKPDCEAAKKSARSFKGCSLKKKQRFTEEYLEFIKQEMLTAARNKTHGFSLTSHQEVAKWKMIALDTNNNEILDRREWKIFRKDWKVFRKANKRRKKLRKCWRNYLRFCDANSDYRITATEWASCTSLNVATAPGSLSDVPQAHQIAGSSSKVKPHLNRGALPRGRNPLETILIND